MQELQSNIRFVSYNIHMWMTSKGKDNLKEVAFFLSDYFSTLRIVS